MFKKNEVFEVFGAVNEPHRLLLFMRSIGKYLANLELQKLVKDVEES